ncbi:SDR family NAD(P)-dependent oxidoreductase [Lysinibacillus telephonicus]|uniref:SDR family oxidoreductase n=1 Tax=Lysinibacillus telephonicus TaxID=1714840 RepID=A0A3S0KKF3_9BACI|nr:SDR family NAD(P)-dependent oxidoreductase [Lysinibacillus telephonicus]RTQ94134.1 SDR family oxidoreductase [Lysinibacillus telephonicus]
MKRVAIITGAATLNGIGFATAKYLAKFSHVIIADINEKAALHAANILVNEGHSAEGALLDVTNQEAVNSIVNKIIEEHEKIDILVNNAGITRPTRILDISTSEFDLLFKVNVNGTFYMTQAVLPSMIQQRYGRIVNLGSVSAKRGGGVFGGSHYSATKGAVMSFAKAVAREVAEHGITVNSVAPGMIGTGITGNLLDDPNILKEISEGIPAKRIGNVNDVASAIAFLCSEDAGYITGEEIDINGGSHID